ncbi:hypothetical protein [Solidesulfovibrio carbinolicus]|uniref:Uncharacterized protein n=1 Tax=Solidesulfovibrio carbinolicus TaxID=296842 RepID=A0A4P6I4I4_9BACT|nr:hypothetical protein [Solidesulfovibrio carbinolicus]QAZ68889.1 hypothetical protein C3Y92_17280 [Solidesulfovibrio carbinolicus]
MRVCSRVFAVLLGSLLLAACLAVVPAPARAEEHTPPSTAVTLDEAVLVAMLDDLIKYYEDARPAESQIIALLPVHEKSKDSPEYKKLRFLFDTYQKATTSLNNLVDMLYIYLKLGNSKESDINAYVVNRTKNIVTFLNNMVYLLTTRNQEYDVPASSDVQKLYETYLVRLTTLLYELNKAMPQFAR